MDVFGQYEEWFRAVINGDAERVQRGIVEGLDVNARTDHGRTALMLAARFGHAGVIDVMIRGGADLDATIEEFLAPDETPATGNDLASVERAIEAVADKIPAADATGRKVARGVTSLFSALKKHHPDRPRGPHGAVFVEHDEDDAFDAHELSTALCHAAAYGHTDAARRLVAEGADVDAPRWDCTPPLAHAAARGDLSMVGLLVGAGADPDDGFDKRPLEIAAARAHADVLSRLLQAGATVDQTDADGRTPLMHAAENGHLTAVHVLITGGADPNMWEQGETALLCAARNGHEDVVEYLESLVREEIREWVRIEMRER